VHTFSVSFHRWSLYVESNQIVPLTFASGPLKVDSPGRPKYCRLRLEYFRKVSAVLRAKVHALRKASFCSWCFWISCAIKATLSCSLLLECLESQSSSRLYSRSKLSSTEQTWGEGMTGYTCPGFGSLSVGFAEQKNKSLLLLSPLPTVPRGIQRLSLTIALNQAKFRCNCVHKRFFAAS
jgi:hypothetical protein